VQPVDTILRQKQRVIALLQSVQLAHFRLQLAKETLREADLRFGNRRREAGLFHQPLPVVQVLLAAVDDSDLPDQQHLRGILQMRLIRPFQVA